MRFHWQNLNTDPIRQAPIPAVAGYDVSVVLLNNRHVGGVQNRVRRFGMRAWEHDRWTLP